MRAMALRGAAGRPGISVPGWSRLTASLVAIRLRSTGRPAGSRYVGVARQAGMRVLSDTSFAVCWSGNRLVDLPIRGGQHALHIHDLQIRRWRERGAALVELVSCRHSKAGAPLQFHYLNPETWNGGKRLPPGPS